MENSWDVIVIGSGMGGMVTSAALSKLGHKVLLLKTPIKGLYLTGQDVLAPGIPGALWGGILAAASIDPKVFEFESELAEMVIGHLKMSGKRK